MPIFQITFVNDEFSATSEAEVADMAAAKAQAMKGVMEVGAEQIVGGKSIFAAEVTVAGGPDRQRFVLSISVSPLL